MDSLPFQPNLRAQPATLAAKPQDTIAQEEDEEEVAIMAENGLSKFNRMAGGLWHFCAMVGLTSLLVYVSVKFDNGFYVPVALIVLAAGIKACAVVIDKVLNKGGKVA